MASGSHTDDSSNESAQTDLLLSEDHTHIDNCSPFLMPNVSTKKSLKPVSTLETFTMPRSSVLSRMKEFLPKMKQANTDLEKKSRTSDDNPDIEVISKDQPAYIEMDLQLGVLQGQKKGAESANIEKTMRKFLNLSDDSSNTQTKSKSLISEVTSSANNSGFTQNAAESTKCSENSRNESSESDSSSDSSDRDTKMSTDGVGCDRETPDDEVESVLEPVIKKRKL
eukprot:164946_1